MSDEDEWYAGPLRYTRGMSGRAAERGGTGASGSSDENSGAPPYCGRGGRAMDARCAASEYDGARRMLPLSGVGSSSDEEKAGAPAYAGMRGGTGRGALRSSSEEEKPGAREYDGMDCAAGDSRMAPRSSSEDVNPGAREYEGMRGS